MKKEMKKAGVSSVEAEERLTGADVSRRDLLKKGGKYAVATPLVLATLMSPGKSHAVGSDAGPVTG